MKQDSTDKVLKDAERSNFYESLLGIETAPSSMVQKLRLGSNFYESLLGIETDRYRSNFEAVPRSNFYESLSGIETTLDLNFPLVSRVPISTNPYQGLKRGST